MNKTCSKCGKSKNVSEFNKNRTKTDGLQGQCRQCGREYGQNPRVKELRREANKRHRAKYPEREKAKHIVNHAIRDGVLKKQPCKICKSIERVEAHHYDYKNEPYKILWLCPKHHRQLHTSIRALGGTWLTDHEVDIRELYKAKKRGGNV